MLSTSLLQDYKQKENDAQEHAAQKAKTSGHGKSGKSGRITRASGKHMKNVPMGKKSRKRR